MSARRGLPAKKRMRHDAHYVDSLVVRDDGEVIGKMIGLSQIHPNPEQPRKDLGDVEGLADSIRAQGVIEPLIVKQVDDGYMIISGERRYHASLLAELEKVPCIVKNLDKNKILEVALVENLQRKDLHPFEEADGLKDLSITFNYTHDDIAKRLGKSRSSVTESLTLANLGPEVRDAAADAGITAKTMLLGVARCDSLDEQLEMIQRIADGAGRDEVRRQAKRQDRAKPFVFKYKDPNKSFSFNLRFKRSEVERDELIATLETILSDLRTEVQQ